jgi:hypothetical protein
MDRRGEIRKSLGVMLRDFRNKKGLSAYMVALKGSIRIDQVNAVETGNKHYTVDALIGYVNGCGLSIQIVDRENPALVIY